MKDEVIREARSWLGVKWQHQGRTRLGIDCAGLVVRVGQDLGVEIEDYTAYPRRPDGTFLRRFRERFVEKSVRDAEPGDMLVFVFGSAPCHTGILAWKEGRYTLIHAHAFRRKVTEEPMWSVRGLAGSPSHCFAYPGAE